MNLVDMLRAGAAEVLELGGPVVALLIVTSILTLSLVLYKFWQFQVSGVGRHRRLSEAVDAWDAGDRAMALTLLKESSSYLAPILGMAFVGSGEGVSDRTDAEAEECFARLERGLATLDMVAQLAPLLGLFGTVLGMIEAFQALQHAGSSVDPSLLAGGIWVALLTTAAGLAVAMPTSLVLSWFEARMRRERVFVNRALRTAFAPGHRTRSEGTVPGSLVHGG